MNRIRVDGTDFIQSYEIMQQVIGDVRETRRPWLVHAKVCLLNHHTSGVRKEFYRTEEDLAKHFENDPLPKLKSHLLQTAIDENSINNIESEIEKEIKDAFARAVTSAEPDPKKIYDHVFLPTSVTEEKGQRMPAGKGKIMMVDAALFAIQGNNGGQSQCCFIRTGCGKEIGWCISRNSNAGRAIWRSPCVQYCHTGSVYNWLHCWHECCRSEADR